MNIVPSVTELIGRTPLLELRRYSAAHELPTALLGKVECMTAGGSA